jgi:hypothetical protein
MPDHSDSNLSTLYGPEYYASHCGSIPYCRNDHWLRFFGGVADAIVRSFAPRRLFDAGCAIGLLVECLWDRGVEAHGRDISDWAISQVRADVRPWCKVGSIAEPVGGEYDMITCIEVLEHIPEEEALRAIAVLAAAAPRILFSSTPTDLDEPTHVNVRPTAYWLGLWAEVGFAPSVTHDAGYLAPHAYILERSEQGRSPLELVGFADRVRHRVALSQVGSAMSLAQNRLAESESSRADLQVALADAEATLNHTRAALQAELEETRAVLQAQLKETSAALQGELDDIRRRYAGLRDEIVLTHAARDAAETAASDVAEIARHAVLERNKIETDLTALKTQTDMDIASLRGEVGAARQAMSVAQSERWAVLNSTTWRAILKVRRTVSVVPRPLRRLMRRCLKLLWWTVTLQLAARLRNHAARVGLLNTSPYFDASWYLSANPDVAVSGLAPARHYAKFGGVEGRDPGPSFSTRLYQERHPDAVGTPGGIFFHAMAHGTVADGEKPLPLPAPSTPQIVQSSVSGDAAADDAGALVTVGALFNARFPDLSALPVYAAPHTPRRLTVITDSIGGGSLYGGVGTALIFAALAAKRLDASLRLVTRTEAADTAPIAALLRINGIAWDRNIDAIYAPRAGGPTGHDIPASDDDLFLTTSWWTTWAARQSIQKARIAYFVQEDERMFYPLGDDHLRCTETLSAPDVLYLVNSELLLRHFHDQGLMRNASAFEPSFPAGLYYRPAELPREAGTKRKFFFYARPHNARNLYWRGIEAISAAIDEDVLNPEDWDFYFAGHGSGQLSLPRGARPIIPGPMAWATYADFVRGIDVGLSLMYTPHPSYPPLDLAASGGVVVTNRFSAKRNLDQYSSNIICSDLDVASLVAALRQATSLSANTALRTQGFSESRLQRDWETSMAPALDRFVNWSEA